MVTFYPNLNPGQINDDVFAYKFWTYLPSDGVNIGENGTFVPSGMVFGPVPAFNNKIIGFPNSDIRRMSKKQYELLKKNIMRQIIVTIWDNASKSEQPIGQVGDKNYYRYTFLDIVIPSAFTEQYDLTAQPGFVAEAKKQLIDDLYDIVNRYINNDNFFTNPVLGFFGNPSLVEFASTVAELLPQYVSAIEVNFDPKNLQKTLCRYYDDLAFFDCNLCLPFEASYLSDPDTYSKYSQINNLKSLIIRQYNNIRLSDQLIRQLRPNCDLCTKYVVYCTNRPMNLMEDADMVFVIPQAPTPQNTLVIDLFDTENLDEEDYSSSAKFFNSYEDAFEYVESIAQENKTKWVCLPEPGAGMAMGTEIVPFSRDCYEVYEICADAFVAEDSSIIKYNTLAECEENCGKKWYCLEYQCTLVDETSQLVEGMQGYDTQEECEQNCVIPTIEPPTETPS